MLGGGVDWTRDLGPSPRPGAKALPSEDFL